MMIKKMLDTNILIYATNNLPPAVLEKLASFKKGEVAVSAIAWAEYCVGVHKFGVDNSNIEDLVDILPFGADAADAYGKLAAARLGGRANGFDRLIAAHAISLGVPLVTNNVADFQPYLEKGLVVENWA